MPAPSSLCAAQAFLRYRICLRPAAQILLRQSRRTPRKEGQRRSCDHSASFFSQCRERRGRERAEEMDLRAICVEGGADNTLRYYQGALGGKRGRGALLRVPVLFAHDNNKKRRPYEHKDDVEPWFHLILRIISALFMRLRRAAVHCRGGIFKASATFLSAGEKALCLLRFSKTCPRFAAWRQDYGKHIITPQFTAVKGLQKVCRNFPARRVLSGGIFL